MDRTNTLYPRTDFLIVYVFKKILSTLSLYFGTKCPRVRAAAGKAAVCRIERKTAYGHNLFQETQNQQGGNRRPILERAV